MGDKSIPHQRQSLLEPSGSQKEWRLFVGIPLWNSLRESAEGKCQSLNHAYRSIRWVRPENWHITLLFLGPVQPERVDRLSECLREAAASHSQFDIELAGLGGFPRLSKARVVWVGVKSGKDLLSHLAVTVRQACAGIGLPGDKKPFEAHLTLGRARSEPVGITVEPEIYSQAWGTHTVREIHLIRSFLEKSGPRYESVSVGTLK
ncbi:MAG: RNA 2',3'-cyclic phosphodiesterase [Candidatus Omnitrophica bacterium]|nr:RNA 2',3'-cyclic phosphodiesterase [bacterium]MBK7495776.1 RNA 2',3'-cyclic phosphodiesterase [Candidatus Omnitrophota bacterium]MBV6481230.1 RNA 2',3'-cyclic phosphodiesterase [bacterium]MCC6732654.1 RNA 2',3'-cyclic phosphodiesterase [Candidatus Omnitrophota bacterium]MCK6497276.1 RNA 2',3'-cyclic phosphodiesterase [bacterium]